MSSRALYVTPEATIESAMDLVRLQQLELVPVVDGERLVGVLDSLELYRFNGELPVREVMRPPVWLEAEAPLGEAAALMLQHHLRQLPITEGGRLAGILSYRDLLATWGASLDPLTGLPWQDHTRRWASAHLASGREIAVLFADLDQFGLLNKTHGHVTADQLLKAVANALKACVDPRRDSLCRYGGDEFVIATTRPQEEAWELARRARAAILSLSQSDSGAPVGVSIGLAGGKRRSPRPGDHASSTLDDLINWASRASTRAKTEAEHLVVFQGTGPRGPEFGTEPAGSSAATESAGCVAETGHDRIVVETYTLSQGEPGARATVSLRFGDRIYTESAQHAGGDRLSAVALATVACLQRIVIPDARLSDLEVRVLPGAGEAGIVAALVSLTLRQHQERLLGAVQLREDRYRSVIRAVLDAVNRRLRVLVRQNEAARPAAHRTEPDDGDPPGSGATLTPGASPKPRSPEPAMEFPAGPKQEREEHSSGATRGTPLNSSRDPRPNEGSVPRIARGPAHLEAQGLRASAREAKSAHDSVTGST